MFGAFGVGGHLGEAEGIVVGGPQQRMTFGAWLGTEKVGAGQRLEAGSLH